MFTPQEAEGLLKMSHREFVLVMIVTKRVCCCFDRHKEGLFLL